MKPVFVHSSPLSRDWGWYPAFSGTYKDEKETMKTVPFLYGPHPGSIRTLLPPVPLG